MRYIIIFLLMLTYSCAKPKSVLICGDHKCINKSEAKQYFEDNLTIEVQILSEEQQTNFSLVDLNISETEQNINIYKNQNKKIVKKLSKEEIKVKKAELKAKKNKSKIKTKITKKDTNPIINKKNEIVFTNKSQKIYDDICAKLVKCDIDSITKYLIKASNKKGYPNISVKE